MKLQGTTSEKGEKEQETKGKGTHTARAGREARVRRVIWSVETGWVWV